MQPSPEMRPVFAQTTLKEHPDDYVIVSIKRDEEETARRLLFGLAPFSSVTFDHEEVSAVLRSADWEALRGDFDGYGLEGPYRVITFDIVLDLSLVGYLSVVSTRLAEAGISVYALSTYLRDHIMVKKQDAPKALEALQALVEECMEN